MTIELDRIHRFRGHAVRWTALGEGPALVMIHGTPFSSQVWRRIAPLAARSRRVYLFDLLGYGVSDKPDGDVSLGVQDALLAELLALWGLDRPEVLAHDFGGATALRAWFLRGARYGRLTLVDPVAIAPWGSPFVAHVRHHEPAFAGLPAYAHRALLDAYLQGASHSGLDAATLELYRSPWEGAEGQPAFYRQIAQMDQRFTDEAEERYAPLDCPVTLLWGEEDAWIPLSQGRRLASMLEVDRFLPVPGAGHLVQDDAPEAIVAALLS